MTGVLTTFMEPKLFATSVYQCAVPENIRTPPKESIGIFWGLEGSRPKNLN